MNTVENGINFDIEVESTWPPPETFVITNYSSSPMYFDRSQKRWWTAVINGDVSGYDDFYFHDTPPIDLYWQPIVFVKAEVMLIASA